MTYLTAISPTLATPAQLVHIRQYRARDGTGTYDVETTSVDVSRRIRSAYGSFWKKTGNQESRQLPQVLAGISINISHTFPTRVRVRILKEIAKRHQSVNKEMSVFVTGYTPRPALKIRESRGPVGRLSSFSYTEAVQRFSHHLSPEFLRECSQFAHTNLSLDSLLPTFLVLSPDLVQSHNPITPDRPLAQGQAPKRFATDLQTPATKRSTPSFQQDATLDLSNQFQALTSPETITVAVSPSSILRQPSFNIRRDPVQMEM